MTQRLAVHFKFDEEERPALGQCSQRRPDLKIGSIDFVTWIIAAGRRTLRQHVRHHLMLAPTQPTWILRRSPHGVDQVAAHRPARRSEPIANGPEHGQHRTRRHVAGIALTDHTDRRPPGRREVSAEQLLERCMIIVSHPGDQVHVGQRDTPRQTGSPPIPLIPLTHGSDARRDFNVPHPPKWVIPVCAASPHTPGGNAPPVPAAPLRGRSTLAPTDESAPASSCRYQLKVPNQVNNRAPATLVAAMVTKLQPSTAVQNAAPMTPMAVTMTLVDMSFVRCTQPPTLASNRQMSEGAPR